MNPVTFFALEQYHDDLADLFARHQRAAVERRFDDALALLKHYRAALECHTQEEELELYPVLRAFAGNPPGGSVEQFKAEHARLLHLLNGIDRKFEAAAADPTPAGVIALIEEEAHFKNLFEHHIAREHNVLFPTLDGVLGDAERARVIHNCTLRVAATGEGILPRPEGHEAIVPSTQESP